MRGREWWKTSGLAAVDALAPGGFCGVVGAPPFGAEVALDVNTVIAQGRTVKGNRRGRIRAEHLHPQADRALARGRFPVDKLIRTYDLDAINEAAADAEHGDTIKPVLLMN